MLMENIVNDPHHLNSRLIFRGCPIINYWYCAVILFIFKA